MCTLSAFLGIVPEGLYDVLTNGGRVMGFEREVRINLDRAPAPQQWNGEQDCQVCGNRLGWDRGTSKCGHVSHSRPRKNGQTGFSPIWSDVSPGTQ
jgi:hypothetical protein